MHRSSGSWGYFTPKWVILVTQLTHKMQLTAEGSEKLLDYKKK
jgi:hypothetical protein